MVDYIVDFVKKDGSTRPRIFKLTSLDMGPGETRLLSRSQRMPANASTFTLFPVTHRITVQMNGLALAETEFELLA